MGISQVATNGRVSMISNALKQMARLVINVPIRCLNPLLIAWPLSYKKLHWLPVRHCMVYEILSLLYKAINGTVPCHICDLFDYRNSKGTLRSSSQYPLATPKARLKTCGERTFAVAAPGQWNSIPLGIRSSSSINSFKRHLKTYPLNKLIPFFKFFLMVNLFNYLRSFKLVYSYIGIYIFFLSFFSFSFLIISISSAIDNIRGFSAVYISLLLSFIIIYGLIQRCEYM